eukprot:TRINITY_DN4641_c0_g2_i2.p1 TRINITY_DN4641_c0_g2~~TRINITY_DN4641_c0_g2_i2.p1  ORF type:complete len:673 (+),score=168.77 TRINITY_DN4641_c0_g2_i2:104-2122(+)
MATPYTLPLEQTANAGDCRVIMPAVFSGHAAYPISASPMTSVSMPHTMNVSQQAPIVIIPPSTVSGTAWAQIDHHGYEEAVSTHRHHAMADMGDLFIPSTTSHEIDISQFLTIDGEDPGSNSDQSLSSPSAPEWSSFEDVLHVPAPPPLSVPIPVLDSHTPHTRFRVPEVKREELDLEKELFDIVSSAGDAFPLDAFPDPSRVQIYSHPHIPVVYTHARARPSHASPAYNAPPVLPVLSSSPSSMMSPSSMYTTISSTPVYSVRHNVHQQSSPYLFENSNPLSKSTLVSEPVASSTPSPPPASPARKRSHSICGPAIPPATLAALSKKKNNTIGSARLSSSSSSSFPAPAKNPVPGSPSHSSPSSPALSSSGSFIPALQIKANSLSLTSPSNSSEDLMKPGRDEDIKPCTQDDCPVCLNDTPPCLQAASPSWAAILRVVFYSLKMAHPSKEFFNLRNHVYDFVNAHWAKICIGKTRSDHWRKQLQDTLAHNKKLFVSGAEVFKQKGYWRLEDLTSPWEAPAALVPPPVPKMRKNSCPNLTYAYPAHNKQSSSIPVILQSPILSSQDLLQEPRVVLSAKLGSINEHSTMKHANVDDTLSRLRTHDSGCDSEYSSSDVDVDGDADADDGGDDVSEVDLGEDDQHEYVDGDAPQATIMATNINRIRKRVRLTYSR